MSKLEPPLLSVIIAAYHSEDTIERSLAALTRQTDKDYEIIVVDSSPGDATGEIVRTRFPEVWYEHSSQRLFPHAARNLGATLARGGLFLFTDPDIYADADWIERLRQARGDSDAIVIGSVRCYGSSWLDLGIHFSKYANHIPAGEVRSIEHGHTAALLCSRQQYLQLGGFIGDIMGGDTLFSMKAREQGLSLQFRPDIVAEHHHIQSWSRFLRERFVRGREMAQAKVEWHSWSRRRIWRDLLLTLFGIRLVHKAVFIGRQAADAKVFSDYLRTLPVWLSGEASWNLGQIQGLGGILLGRDMPDAG